MQEGIHEQVSGKSAGQRLLRHVLIMARPGTQAGKQ